jgi:alpha-glucosidase (family GH31 glycosyl hydrolase)
VKKNYYDLGIKLFWLDAEPEYRAYDFDNYRYHAGPAGSGQPISSRFCPGLL